MAPASIDAASFTLTHDGERVTGTVSYDDATRRARFLPSASLRRSAAYVATISSQVSSADGQTLDQPYTWTFTTAARGWDAPAVLEHDVHGVESAIADRAGDIHVLWTRYAAPSSEVWSRRFVAEPSAGWSPPSSANPRVTGLDGEPRAVLDAAGDLTLFWDEELEGHQVGYRWVRRQAANELWDDPRTFDEIANNTIPMTAAYMPAVTATGTRTALYWGVAGNTSFGLWTSYRIGGADWSEPRVVDPVHASTSVQAIPGPGDDITIIWGSWENGPLQLCARLHGETWSSPVRVSEGKEIMSREVQAHADGAIDVVWQEIDHSFRFSTWARHFTPASGWQPIVPLADQNVTRTYPTTALDADGNVLALWVETVDTGNVIVARRRRADGTWESAAPVARLGLEDYGGLRLVVAGDGTVMALWTMHTAGDTYDVMTSVYH